MKFTIAIMPEAQANILEAFEYISTDSPENAGKWLRGLYEQIDTLEMLPNRCGCAREQEHFDEPIRQLVFKSHRIVFMVDEATNSVSVIYVRHASRIHFEK